MGELRVNEDLRRVACAALVATSATAIYEVLQVGHRRRGLPWSLDGRDVRRQLDALADRGHLERRHGGYVGARSETMQRVARAAAEHGEAWSVLDLAAEVGVHRTTVGGLVRTWEAYGLVAEWGERTAEGRPGRASKLWRWVGLEDALVAASDQVAPVAGDELAVDHQAVAGDELHVDDPPAVAGDELHVDAPPAVAGDELALQHQAVAGDEFAEGLDVDQVGPVTGDELDPYQLHVLAALRIATERWEAAVRAWRTAFEHAEQLKEARHAADRVLYHARELAQLAGVGGHADG